MPMESNTSTRLSELVNRISGVGIDTAKDGKRSEQFFQALAEEAAKLRESGVIASIPLEKLILFLNVLRETVNRGLSNAVLVSECSKDDDHERQTQSSSAMPATNAALLIVNILLSTNKFKEAYLHDILKKVISFLNCQLNEFVLPYWGCNKIKTLMNRTRPENKDKNILPFNDKIVQIVSLLTKIVMRDPLQSSPIPIEVFNLCLSIVLLEKSYETKHPSLQFIISVFIYCKNYQKLMFQEMLKALDSFAKSVYLLDTCELKPGCKIHTLTLLLLHLTQSVAYLPSTDDHIKPTQLNWDAIIAEKCKSAHALVADIMYQLCLKWVSMKNTAANVQYKIVVENVVRDLLALVNLVEWPAAEVMLSCLANTFVTFVAKQQVDCSLSSCILDYLTLILLNALENSAAIRNSNINVLLDGYKGMIVNKETANSRYYSAYLMIMDNLANKLPSDMCLTHAYIFHIHQCYEHLLTSTPLTDSQAIQNKHKRKFVDSSDEEMDQQLKKKGCKKYKRIKVKTDCEIKMSSHNLKVILVHKLTAQSKLQESYKKCCDTVDHELIMQYINTLKPVAQKFEYYLKHILKVVVSNCAVQLRTRAMKCISMLVGADPKVLGNYLVHKFVNRSFLDTSIAVREAAIDLIGVQVTSRPHLINDYYESLSARILDTGISVRKRVIDIFQSICSKYPDFSKRPEMYCKLLRRMNDETGIQNQVVSIFQNIWFTPISASYNTMLLEKIRNMVDVIDQLKNDQFFEKLLLNVFATERSEHSEVSRSSQSVLTACEQIVDGLVEYIIKCKDAPEKVVLCVEPCLKILCVFAKVKPELMVKHTNSFVPYLSIKSKVQGETQIIINITFILELVVPTLKNPNVEFIRELETELISLSVHPDPTVVERSVACLAPIVTNISHSYSLITYLLKKCHTVLLHTMHKDSQVEIKTYTLQRSLYMVGLLFRYFDFSDKKNITFYEIPENIQELVFKSCLFFARALDESVKTHAFNAIGLVCVRCNDLLLNSEIQALYIDTLSNGQASVTVKIKILKNIDLYLEQDENLTAKKEAESRDVVKEGSIKEMDMASSTASKMIQLYLKPILKCYLNRNETIRFTVHTVVKRVLDQGLLHPVEIVPSLIAMSTDDRLHGYANDQLKLIELKYPGFIHMKAMVGVKLAYQLQTEVLQANSMVRGFDETKGWPRALHGFLFANFRSQLQRRAFLTSMLKRFQEPKTNLAEMLYLADNVAQLPFSVQDEILFVVNSINNMLALMGSNVLEAFQQALLPPKHDGGQNTIISDGNESEEEENETGLMERIPEDIGCFKVFAIPLNGCLLLLSLKKHLMTCYGLADMTVSQYTPTKSFNRKITIKRKLKFNPNTIIKIIQRENEVNDPQSMIANYLELKRLMIEVDSKEE